MKKAVLVMLSVLMALCLVAALAEPTVGSHPQQGDQGGARAAILERLLGQGGTVANQAILDALGIGFGAVGASQNSDAVRGKGTVAASEGTGSDSAGSVEKPDGCACSGMYDCGVECMAGCECSTPSVETTECGPLGPGALCDCEDTCIGGECCVDSGCVSAPTE